MTEQNVTTAPIGAETMLGALTAYGIDPATSVTLKGARAIIGAADAGEGARAVWVYWVTEGCDVASRWTVAQIKDRLSLSDSAVTKDKKTGALLSRCGSHAADVATVKSRNGITLLRAVKRASNDWDKKTCDAYFGTAQGVALRDLIWSAWDLLTSRAAAGQDAYGRPKTAQPSAPEPTGAEDAGEGAEDAGEDTRTVTRLTTDESRAAAAGSTLAAIGGPVDDDAARAILAHAFRIAIASGLSSADIMAEWTAASDAAGHYLSLPA